MHVPWLVLSSAYVLAVVSAQQGGGKLVVCNTVEPVYDCYYSQCYFPKLCAEARYQALYACYANSNGSQTCYGFYNLCQNKCMANNRCRQC